MIARAPTARRVLLLGLALLAATVTTRGVAAAVEAAELLTETIFAHERLDYRATEVLTTRGPQSTQHEQVRLAHRAPHHSRRDYLSERGGVERVVVDDGRVHWQYIPAKRQLIFSNSLRVDRALRQLEHLDLLQTNYAVEDGGEVMLAGVPTRLLSISPLPGHVGPRKRLWVDRETKLTRQSELTTSDGQVQLISTLTGLLVRSSIADREFDPPKQAKRQSVVYERAAVLPVSALARQVKHPLLVPGYLPGGYRLESARLVRRARRAYVHLRYFDGLNAFSLFEEAAARPRAPAARGRARPQGSSKIQEANPPFHTLTWRERDVKLTLVGDLPDRELLRISKSMRGAK